MTPATLRLVTTTVLATLLAFAVGTFALKACTAAAEPMLRPAVACPQGTAWLPAPEFHESGARECR